MHRVSTRFIYLLGILFTLSIVNFSIVSGQGRKLRKQQLQDSIQKHINTIESHLAIFLPKTDSITGYASLTERMTYYKVQGLSIAVINDGKLEWAKAYGYADIDEQILASPGTLFQAASISKSLNALCVMKCVDARKLSLDNDVDQYMQRWSLPKGDKFKDSTVSLAQLLSHSAGLNVSGFSGYEEGKPRPATTVDILNGTGFANNQPIKFIAAPGSKFRYSGGGITVVQEILEEIFRAPYATILDKKVLKSLRMSNSTFQQPLPEAWRAGAATGYRVTGKAVAGKYHIYPEQAAAGLWTTPTDLAKFIIAVQQSYNKKRGFIKQATAKRMLSPYLADSNVGLGVFLSKWGGTPFFNHGGGNEGFRSFYCGSLSTGKGLIIMINSDNDRIFKEIVYTVAKEYNWKNDQN